MHDDIIKKIAPRDIFNEANFIKNIAQLFQEVKTGTLPGIGILFNEDSPQNLTQWFSIYPADGAFILNADMLDIRHREKNATYSLKRSMNARGSNSIFFEDHEYGAHDVFNDDGTLSPEIQALFSQGPATPPHAPDSNRLFAYSLFLKGIGKLALNGIPMVDTPLPGLFFDEKGYTEHGIPFEEEDGYFYLDDEISLVSLFEQSVQLRAPNQVTTENAWPLEFSLDGKTFQPVFDSQGQYLPTFNQQDVPAIPSTPTPPADAAPSEEVTARPRMK
jgi:hypothetical protein